MKSTHKILICDARRMEAIENDTVELVVTSPPYPMIEMWDDLFSELNPTIGDELERKNGTQAFNLMHRELDKVWMECYRVLKPGCLACINIGDAVRTINGSFRMYSNHANIIKSMCDIGFSQLPDILWRKQTNAPNKFMGSGMLPSCAYVTYEHEYILIFRKGENRRFVSKTEKECRRKSAFYWEERNVWFSDVWMDLKGTSQVLCDKSARERSAAYPFELPYRIICMNTIYGDTILDPFIGTGTTTAAAISSCRNSIGIDISSGLKKTIQDSALSSIKIGRRKIFDRLQQHKEFMRVRSDSGKKIKYLNRNHNVPTVTAQETDIMMFAPKSINRISNSDFEVDYEFATADIMPPTDQLSMFAS